MPPWDKGNRDSQVDTAFDSLADEDFNATVCLQAPSLPERQSSLETAMKKKVSVTGDAADKVEQTIPEKHRWDFELGKDGVRHYRRESHLYPIIVVL